MIVRSWSARATAEGAKKYLAHFRRHVLPQLQRIAGYQGALLLRRRRNKAVEIQVLTFWKSRVAIRQFAGTDPDTAVVEEEAREILREFDTHVAHFDLVLDARL